jgi:hypothetical protein
MSEMVHTTKTKQLVSWFFLSGSNLEPTPGSSMPLYSEGQWMFAVHRLA